MADECAPKVIVFNSTEACPKLSIGALWVFINDFNYIFGIVLILFGAFLVSFGNKYYEQTLFLLGMSAAATFFLIVMYMTVIPSKSEDWMIFVMIIIACGLGTVAGFAMKKFAQFGIIVTAAWLGGVLGSMAYSALLRLITIQTYPLLVLWLTIFAFAGIAGYLANRYFDVAVIFGSAIIGSFLLFRVSKSFNLNLLKIGNC